MAYLRARVTVVLLSLISLLLTVTSGQLSARILDLQVVGGDGSKGYVQATVLYGNASTATGPVCGSVTGTTATFACYSIGLFASNGQGTVDSFEGISRPTSAPVVSSLSCNSYSNDNGQVTYGCSFSSTATCTPGDSAAVSCNLTGGELAAIIVVCILVLLVVITVIVLLSVFCCCPKQTVCYQALVIKRIRSRRGVVPPRAHVPTSYQEPHEEAVLSELEPPKYQETMAEGHHDSSPPPYKQ